MSSATSPITDQAGVNAAENFDMAAESLLGIDATGGSDETDDGASVAQQKPSESGAASKAEGQVEGKAGVTIQDGQQPAAAQAQVDEWAIDDGVLAKALADPVHGAIVKQLADQRTKLMGYREHWTIEEARAARELAPGGLEELKASVQAGRDAISENAEFASGDPARQGAALKNIAADMPEAFAAGVTPYLQTLRDVNPEAYTRTVGQIAVEALKAEGLPDLIGGHFAAVEAMRAAAEKGDEKAFEAAFAQVVGAQEFRNWAQRAGIRVDGSAAPMRPAAIDPKVAELEKELKGYREKEAAGKHTETQQLVKEWGEFTKSVDDSWQKLAKPEVDKLLEVVPKNMSTAAREQLVVRLNREIVGELQKRINDELEKGFGDLKRKVDAVVTGRAWKTGGDRAREQVVNLIHARAKVLLPHVAKSILDPFSSATVAAAKDRAAQEDMNGSRTDLRGGASGPKNALPLTVVDMKGNGRGAQMSDEEILDL